MSASVPTPSAVAARSVELADGLVVVDLAGQHAGRQHPLHQVVVAREADPGGGGEHPGGEQRLGDPLGVAAAAPPASPRPARLGGQMRLDLPGSAGPEFGDGGDDLVRKLRGWP